MSFCGSCGAGRAAGSFCPRCGARYDSARPEQDDPQDADTLGPARDAALPAPRRRGLLALGLVLLVVLAGGAFAVQRLVHRGPDRVAASTTPPPSTPAPTTGATPTATPSDPASPAAATFPELYRTASTGVVRIQTTACDGGGVGSGFLIAPDLVATVAHVVDGAVSVALRQGTSTTTGTVVGFDRVAELALVRSSEPLTGHVFTLASTQPDVGVDVAAIGYPLAGDEALTKGAISGLDRGGDAGAGIPDGLIQTDTTINPGNSGGPLLLLDGTVTGLVEAKSTQGDHIGFAIPATTASPRLAAWRDAPTPIRHVQSCTAEGPHGLDATVTDSSRSDVGGALAAAFTTYANAINAGDYHTAYNVLSPSAQARTGYPAFRDGTLSSYIIVLDVSSVSPAGTGRQVAEVSFTSLQDPDQGARGQTCSEWRMTYTMASSTTGWRIDSARPHAGSPTAC